MSMQETRPWQATLPFYYGWVIVSLGFVSAFFGIGMTWAAGLLAVPMHAELGRARRAENPSFTLAEALGTSTFWVLMLAVSIGGLTGNGIPATLAAIFVDRGFTFQAAGAALMWYGVASIGSKLVWGWVANRQDTRRVLLLLTAYGVIALPSILFIPATAGSASLAYGFLVGMFIGANVPLSQLVWAEYFGRAQLRAISSVGRPLGLVFMSGGPFVLAATRDITGSYNLGILLNALAVAIFFACIYFLRPPAPPRRHSVDGAVDPWRAELT